MLQSLAPRLRCLRRPIIPRSRPRWQVWNNSPPGLEHPKALLERRPTTIHAQHRVAPRGDCLEVPPLLLDMPTLKVRFEHFPRYVHRRQCYLIDRPPHGNLQGWPAKYSAQTLSGKNVEQGQYALLAVRDSCNPATRRCPYSSHVRCVGRLYDALRPTARSSSEIRQPND
eukprot:scaffold221251_cov32-Tisochrysis_lutea.AAC.8